MRIGVIGCGTMGSAFAQMLSKKHTLFLSSGNNEKIKIFAEKIGATIADSITVCQTADLLILCVKPKDIDELAKQICKSCSGKIVISLLAGVRLATLQSLFPKAHLIRVMPNLPIICGEGILGIVEPLDPMIRQQIVDLFDGMGLVYFLPETKMDAFTALCGSSPAFILLMMEAMMEGAVALGFALTDARQLILQAFKGAVALLEDTQTYPSELKMKIASPGGTTIAGLQEMELRGIRAGLIQTLFACYRKSCELAGSG